METCRRCRGARVVPVPMDGWIGTRDCPRCVPGPPTAFESQLRAATRYAFGVCALVLLASVLWGAADHLADRVAVAQMDPLDTGLGSTP